MILVPNAQNTLATVGKETTIAAGDIKVQYFDLRLKYVCNWRKWGVYCFTEQNQSGLCNYHYAIWRRREERKARIIAFLWRVLLPRVAPPLVEAKSFYDFETRPVQPGQWM